MKQLTRIVTLIFVLSAVCACKDDEKSSEYGTLTVTVEDESGKPLDGVTLTMLPTTESPTEKDNGLYEFTNLKPGKYDITASLVGYNDATVEVDVQKREQSKKIVLTGAMGKIEGVITSASGTSLDSAYVVLMPSCRIVFVAKDGSFSFDKLAIGTSYRLHAFRVGYKSVVGKAAVASLKPDKAEGSMVMEKYEGGLWLDKVFIDMGDLNEVSGYAAFEVKTLDEWRVFSPEWISVEADYGQGNGSGVVLFSIDREKLNNIDANQRLGEIKVIAGGSERGVWVSVSGMGKGVNVKLSSESVIPVDGFYVMSSDMGGRMDWISADRHCKDATAGDFEDWELPNTAELGRLFAMREVIGGFITTSDDVGLSSKQIATAYWTADKSTNASYPYYWMSFYDGTTGYSYISGSGDNYTRRCRCVRRASPLPVVVTLAVTNLTANSVTLNGRIEKSGEPPFTERGFVYSTFPNPTIGDDSTTRRIASNIGTDFSVNVYGLTAEQTYYVSAYATNSNGTIQGEVFSFKPTAIVEYMALPLDGIVVQKYDRSSGASWNEAKSLCESLSLGEYSDWRLPSIGELQALYGKKEEIGNFSTMQDNNYYWSSTASNSYSSYHDVVNFYSGTVISSTSNSTYSTSSNRVRCVHTME